jgi:hypothetical protein
MAKEAGAGFEPQLLRRRRGVAVAESGSSGEASAEEVVHMDMEGFRDKADDAINKGEEEVDERTGGRFDEQTDRATDEVRERGEGVLGDQQEGEPPA